MTLSDEKILKLYASGFSLEKIWETYDVEVAYIRKLLAQENIKIRENKHD